MEEKVLNYRVIIEPDRRLATDDFCFTAYCPTLGIADSGDTVEEALSNIKEAISVWIETLIRDEMEVPKDDVTENAFITMASVKAPKYTHQAFL